MQCKECDEVYQAESISQPCSLCGGRGQVLKNVTGEYNRKTRRKMGAIRGKTLGRIVPCPRCQKTPVKV